MRVLILGAGAVGGYFGGRMAQAGSDVVFLVREGRAEQLRSGLVIESPLGNSTIPVSCITGNDTEVGPVDVVIVSCKSYGLAGATEAIAPYVTPDTALLPLLNGYAHLEFLESRFPDSIVWGGVAGIVATLTDEGIVRHMQPAQQIGAGLRVAQRDDAGKLNTLVAEMTRAGINASVSSNIELAMWEKWAFLATLASATCFMRGSLGEILNTDHGRQLIEGLYDECNRTAAAEGFPPSDSPAQDYRSILFEEGSPVTASMYRDMEASGPTEAEHIVGDMIRRAKNHGISVPLLNVAYAHLQVYEARRSTI